MDQLNTKRPDETKLPSRFQINDRVSLCIDGKVVQCKVHAIHFLPSKVKYDLDAVIAYYPVCSETPNGGEAYTRLYNIDGACVTDPYVKTFDQKISGSLQELTQNFGLLLEKANASLNPDEHEEFLNGIINSAEALK